MSSRHRPGSGRRYEGLLDGTHSDGSALSGLLDAARAPGTREDMAGLPAARTAFMSVPYVRTRPAASVSKLPAATRTAAGRLLALKLLAGFSGATLLGGAAYAATGANLLTGGSARHHKHSASSSVAAPHSRLAGAGVGPQVLPGAPRPTPPAGPQPSSVTHGNPGGLSSSARAAHSPSRTPGGSNSTRPHPSHAASPHPSPTPRNSSTPHHKPTPHDTNSHTPNPHKSSPGHGRALLPEPRSSNGVTP